MHLTDRCQFLNGSVKRVGGVEGFIMNSKVISGGRETRTGEL